MALLTIYVPEPLGRMVKDRKGIVNISKICQEALRAAIENADNLPSWMDYEAGRVKR